MTTDRLIEETKANGFSAVSAKTEEEVVQIATKLGEPLVEERDPRLYRVISPIPRSASRPNTLSSRYGTGVFPFHTDTAYWLTPPRFLLLHCIHPGSGNRPTLLIDSTKWRLSYKDRSKLLRGLWIVAGKRAFLTTTFRNTPASSFCRLRYDGACMRPAGKSGEEAAHLLGRLIQRSRPREISWSKGMLLVIDNHRMLHSRGEASAPDPDRRLGRLLVGETP